MVNVVRRECRNEGCSTVPSYGVVVSRKAECCAKNAKEGMVDFTNKVCGNDGCSVQSSHGMVGSRKAEFCAKHAREGMVNVVRKEYRNHSCSILPSYGVVGNGHAESRARRTKEGVLHVSEEVWGNDGSLRPYRLAGTRKPDLRIGHALDSMVDVERRSGARVGCSKQPHQGVPGKGKTESCVNARIGVLGINSRQNASEEYRDSRSSVRARDAASMTADHAYMGENARGGGTPDRAVSEHVRDVDEYADRRGTSSRSYGAYFRCDTDRAGSRGCVHPETSNRSDGEPLLGFAQSRTMVHRDVDGVTMGAKVELEVTPASGSVCGTTVAARTRARAAVSASDCSSVDGSSNRSASGERAKRRRTITSVASRQAVPADDVGSEGGQSVKLELESRTVNHRRAPVVSMDSLG